MLKMGKACGLVGGGLEKPVKRAVNGGFWGGAFLGGVDLGQIGGERRVARSFGGGFGGFQVAPERPHMAAPVRCPPGRNDFSLMPGLEGGRRWSFASR